MMMGDKKLRIWFIMTSHEQNILSFLEKRFLQFQSSHDVDIQVEFVTWTRAFSAMVDAFKNNIPPDILQVGTSWVRTLAYMGYIEQIPDEISVKPSINENINNICLYQGKQYAVPWIADTVIMAARSDYMEKYGVKQSDIKDWQGVKDISYKILKWRKKDPKLPRPLAFALRAEGDTLHRFASILWSRGWKFPNLEKPAGNFIFDDIFLDTISYFVDLMLTCGISIDDLEKHPYQLNEEFYVYGSYLFYIGNWYGIIEGIYTKEWENQNIKENYCLLPFPTSLSDTYSYGGGSTLVVSSRSKHKKKAWKLVEFLLSDGFVKDWIVVSGKVPAFDSEFWQKRFEDQRIRVMYEQMINAKVYPAHPAWVTIENTLSKGIAHIIWNMIISNNSTIDKKTYSFLKQLNDKIEGILEISWEMRSND